MIKNIIDKNESDIIKASKEYLQQVEQGKKHYMTPNIDAFYRGYSYCGISRTGKSFFCVI